MFDLPTIIKMNKAPVKVEDNHNRHCSFTQASATEVVLHSAKLRNTVFLEGRKAIRFLNKVRGYRTAERRDKFIESFFAGV
jgi:hypothetical protein